MKPIQSGIKVLFLAPFLLSSSLGLAMTAGGISDGGGNAVVCRDANHKIISAQLLDLYEAENYWGLALRKTDPAQSVLDAALDAAKLIDMGGGGADPTAILSESLNGALVRRDVQILPMLDPQIVEEGVTYDNQNKHLLPTGVTLPALDDSKNVVEPEDFFLPNSCSIERLALYVDSTERLSIVSDIWSQMDSLNQAALLVHESLYRQMRSDGETTSERTRLAVGHAFAGDRFTSILDGIPSSTLLCISNEDKPAYRFALYSTLDGNTVLQFIDLNGKVMLSKTTLSIDPIYTLLGKPENINAPSSLFNIRMALNNTLLDKGLALNVETQYQQDAGSTKKEMRIGIQGEADHGSLPHVISCTPYESNSWALSE
jgi:hypothetical protein